MFLPSGRYEEQESCMSVRRIQGFDVRLWFDLLTLALHPVTRLFSTLDHEMQHTVYQQMNK
jgi:hypothetical protein